MLGKLPTSGLITERSVSTLAISYKQNNLVRQAILAEDGVFSTSNQLSIKFEKGNYRKPNETVFTKNSQSNNPMKIIGLNSKNALVLDVKNEYLIASIENLLI